MDDVVLEALDDCVLKARTSPPVAKKLEVHQCPFPGVSNQPSICAHKLV